MVSGRRSARYRWSDRVPVRLAVFALALATAFGIGASLGATVGPDAEPAVPATHDGDHGG